jgi:hypothetical protein
MGHGAIREFQLIPFFCVGIIACELSEKEACRCLLGRWSTAMMLAGLLLIVRDIEGLRFFSTRMATTLPLVGIEFIEVPVASVDLCLVQDWLCWVVVYLNIVG